MTGETGRAADAGNDFGRPPSRGRTVTPATSQAQYRARLSPEQRHARYLARREAAIATSKAWQAAHPVRAAAIITAGKANRRARTAGCEGRITADDVEAQWRRQPICTGCGAGRGIDHVVPLSRGGANTAANLQTLCRFCNSRKALTVGNDRLFLPGACHCCGSPIPRRRHQAPHCSRRCGQLHRHGRGALAAA